MLGADGIASKDRPAPPFILDAARLARFAALAALPVDDYDRQERAALMKFDVGLTREAAELATGLK
jgi:hypothetical protein